jgi:hypothetical protein
MAGGAGAGAVAVWVAVSGMKYEERWLGSGDDDRFSSLDATSGLVGGDDAAVPGELSESSSVCIDDFVDP